jgi:hypothetical protein
MTGEIVNRGGLPESAFLLHEYGSGQDGSSSELPGLI